jgi:hypothetical protein
MPYTLWTFLALPDGTVERYPQTRHQKFFDGESPIEADVRDAARFIEMALETRKGHPLRMLRAWFTRYELNPEGYLSPAHKMRMMHDAVSGMNILEGSSPDPDVVSLEPLIAQRRNEREHAWQPDKSELEAIVAAINDNAAKDLVRTDGVKLIAL